MPGLSEPIQIGKREDLAELYSIVDQKTTPFCSRVKKSPAPTNVEFDWLVDNYATPQLTGSIDGVDVVAFDNHAINRARLGNYIQVFRRTNKVSRLAEDVSVVAGVKSEVSLGISKRMVEIKRDMEAVFLNGTDGQADTGAVPYLTIGLDLWISTAGPTIPKAVPAAYRPASAQIVTTATASLVEDAIQDMLASIYNATGMNGDYICICGSILRRRFTDMTRTVANTGASTSKVRTFTQTGSSTTVQNTTTIYIGDYGSMEIVSSNFIGMVGATVDTDRGYVLDMDKIHLRMKSMPKVEEFPDLGGGRRHMVEAVGGLQVDNPIGLGKFKP